MMKSFAVLLAPVLALLLLGCGGESDGTDFANPDRNTTSDVPSPNSGQGTTTLVTPETGAFTGDASKAAIRVLAFGDSNVDGEGVAQPWPDKLEIALGQPVFRRGVKNEFTEQGLARFPGELEATNPTHVCIMHGVNDGVNELDPSIPLGNLGRMVDLAKARGAEVIVATLPPVLTTGPWTQESINGRNDLDPRIAPAMAAKGAKIARVSEAIGEGTSLMQRDGIHFNDAGHAIVATLFEQQIR